ncbi:MAG TPA: DUF488 domain-containing protein [Sedimentisphaerales bacterium]|nr:DUF488 domain-containing protein [Sedimentisphaerales bacterium]
MSRELFTVGYEGTDIDNFITHLKDNAINCLLDVRETPLSRKRGFSKTALSERLNRENIYYVHFRELGSPKPIREKLKVNHDYSVFFKRVDEYLTSKIETIENAYRYVRENTCCLMCFEHLAATCHRKIVARKIKELDGTGLQIKNI